MKWCKEYLNGECVAWAYDSAHGGYMFSTVMFEHLMVLGWLGVGLTLVLFIWESL